MPDKVTGYELMKLLLESIAEVRVENNLAHTEMMRVRTEEIAEIRGLLAANGQRISALERWRSFTAGLAAAISTVISIAWHLVRK